MNDGYVLVKNSYNLSGSIKDTQSFVGCGAFTGALFGNFYRALGIKSDSYLKKVNDGSIISSFIVMCATKVQASAMYKNLVSDNGRFNKLAAEVQKQGIVDKMEKERVLAAIQSEIEMPMTNSNTRSNDKRLSLNNGIFKSNDNYN